MKLFDTHCHFETCEIIAVESILSRAAESGVAKLTAIGGSDKLNVGAEFARDVAEQMRADGRAAPDVLIAIGYDRDQRGRDIPVACSKSSHNFQRGRDIPVASNIEATSFIHAAGMPRPLCETTVDAIGEIGLDYHYSPETRKEQMELFAAQLEEARQRDLPVVIHTREAGEDTIGLLKDIPSRGIIHCFTGGPDEAKAYLDLGFYVSMSGIVTFAAANGVRETALVIPDDRILIETDAPFLAPVPMRGNPNEPAFIRHTCAFLANLRGTSPEAFAELTFVNGEKAFARSS